MAYNLNRAATVSSSVSTTFRAWAQVVHDTLVAGGWIQTADTGQINLVTVAAPGAALAGYEIWRSNESGGGIHEIYLKVEYAGGNSSSNNPVLITTIGWGSDGAGNLVNGVVARTNAVGWGQVGSGNQGYLVAAGSGYFYYGLSIFPQALIIDRLRDLAGNKTDEVVQCFDYYINASGYQFLSQVTNYSLGTYAGLASVPNLAATVNSVQFGRAGFGFLFAPVAGFSNPLLSLLLNGTGSSPTISNLYDVMPIKHYGAYHNYVLFPSNGIGSGVHVVRVD